MALSFLQSSGGFDPLGGIASILTAIQGNKTAKNARDRVINMGPTAAESRSNALIEALLQPNNSLVRQQQEEGTRLGIEGLLTQIRAMTNADRRRTARGQRGGLIDPERRDEFLDYSLSRGLPFIQQQALNDARTNIGNQALALKGFMPAQQDRQQNALAARNNYDQYKTQQFGDGIQTLIKSIRRINW